jgi:hypothetical protein
VHYGFGSSLIDIRESGSDLILVFEGRGNGLSESNFTAKLLGKDKVGRLLFGYARLPWVDYPDAPATVFAAAGEAVFDTIRVSDFGALADSRQNVTGVVKAALEEARKKENPLLYFGKGRYDFWPQYCEERVYYESNSSDINPKRLGILVEGFENLVIDGGGANFVFHDRMQPVTVDHSKGVELKNFTIDWDIPLTAQAEVMEVTDKSMLLKIDREESPFVIEDGKIQFVGEGWKSPLRSVMEIERESRLIAP